MTIERSSAHFNPKMNCSVLVNFYNVTKVCGSKLNLDRFKAFVATIELVWRLRWIVLSGVTLSRNNRASPENKFDCDYLFLFTESGLSPPPQPLFNDWLTLVFHVICWAFFMMNLTHSITNKRHISILSSSKVTFGHLSPPRGSYRHR